MAILNIQGIDNREEVPKILQQTFKSYSHVLAHGIQFEHILGVLSIEGFVAQ